MDQPSKTTTPSLPFALLQGALCLTLGLPLGGCALDEEPEDLDDDPLALEDDQFRAGECEVVPLHQYFSSGMLDHLYTDDWESMGRAAGSGGYAWAGIEGYGCANAATGTVPLHEYVRSTIPPNIVDTNHFYSTTYYGQTIDDPIEDYVYLGIVAYVYPSSGSGKKSLNQYYSHNISGTGKRDHFYTTNPNPALDPNWGYGSPTTQGYLKMGHGLQEVPIGYDYDRTLNFYSLPFRFKLWYPADGNFTVYERCVDPSSPDYNEIYRWEVRSFNDGILNLDLASGDECYLRDVGVHVGEWFVRRVSYEGPVSFSY
jgi:hypothetical protein